VRDIDGKSFWYGIRMIGMPVVNGEIRREKKLRIKN
jgi:hypothetical protein